MEQLPKIARQRLRPTAQPGIHPDPNLLAAFAEKSLRETERAQVLLHLSRCSDCREIVTLAAPETLLPATVRPQSRWLRWPVLRWSALAASVIVISAAVTMRYQRRSEPVREFDRTAAKQGVENQSAAPANENDVAKVAPPTALESNPASGTAAPSPNPAAPAHRGSFAATSVSGAQAGAPQNQMARISPRADRALSENRATADTTTAEKTTADTLSPLAKADTSSTSRAGASANQPAAPVVGQMAQSRAAPASAAQSKNANAAAQFSSKEAQADQIGAQSAESVVIATAPANLDTETAQLKSKDESRKVQKKLAGVSASSNLKAAFKTQPTWSLSAAGTLQRSFDAGKTWQTIAVAPKVIFRALAVNDSDIWVGGAAGALYHSSDAGQTWSQVTPADNGQRLTSDIIVIDFSNLQTGKLATSAHETWTTNDAGLTWQRN